MVLKKRGAGGAGRLQANQPRTLSGQADLLRFGITASAQNGGANTPKVPRMVKLVRLNQSAYIRGRQIHKNFRTVQLTCRWLHTKRHPTVLLKVDLAKAFDSVAWSFLLEVLQHASQHVGGTLLGTPSTRVLVNGRPGRRIRHARDLRQGDPLLPLLFMTVMEVLNELIAEAAASSHHCPGT
jgi:hypothetical protein